MLDLSGFDWKNPSYGWVYQERIECLKQIRADPALVPPLKQFYKEHPAHFVSDFCVTYDPRNVERGLEATVPFLLFPKQREFIEWVKARWLAREDGIVEKSRDVGMSWLCMAFAVHMWLFFPGVAVGVGSRKEMYVDDLNNPASLFWKARSLIDHLPVEFKPRGWDQKKHAPYMRLINPENGSTITGESGTSIGRGNRTSIYLVDEAAFLEQPDAIDAALSQTSNCKILVSTPNGAGNPFYRKRHSGKFPVFTFRWTDDVRKDAAWYQKQTELLDPVVVAAEIDLNYESSVSNVFIPAELVIAAQARGPADVPATGGLRVGVDVARFGNDRSVIAIRRGRVLLKLVVLQQLDVTQVAARVRSEVAAYGETPEQIAVDTIGIGAGVADILRGWYPDRAPRGGGRKVPVVQDVNASLRMSDGQHYNLRAYMWAQMREWLRHASLPPDHDLRADLTALRYTYRGGELLLESKDDAKKRGVRSPDLGDALALSCAYPAQPAARPPPTEQPYLIADSTTGVLG